VQRSILNPSSFVELSVQPKVMLLFDLLVTVNAVGAAGGRGSVVAFTVLE
jgi:hypothetical protein